MAATEDGFRSQKNLRNKFAKPRFITYSCIAYEKILSFNINPVRIRRRFAASRPGGLQAGRPAATSNVWTRLLRGHRRGRKHLSKPRRRQNFYGQ